MQEARKEASPDWLAEGGIHSASNPNPGRANTEFHQRRLMLALVAHKTESKIPGPPDMTEKEKSPVNGEGHQLAGPYGNPPRPAGGGILNRNLLGGCRDGNISRFNTCRCSGRGTCSSIERRAGYQSAARSSITQTRSKLVWGLLSSLCRDTNTFSLRAVPHLS